MRRQWKTVGIAAALTTVAACGSGTVSKSGDGGGPSGTSDGGGDIGPKGGAYFPNGSVLYSPVDEAALDANSAGIISWLDGAGGWGTGSMRIDFEIEVVEAPAGTPLRSFEPTSNHFTPDCDIEDIPVPEGGAIEGYPDYECADGGDCHLIVVDRTRQRLYEMWKANIVGSTFEGGCLAVWEMDRVYDEEGRGYGCTSADAAGLPIAPLLFSADEVAAGSIDHAIRFILPNARIRANRYVAPATHSTFATSGDADAPAYGQRLRLRADYPLDSLPSDGARVVARAMQKYGILLADGGNIALTAQSDRFTTAKWDGLLGPRDLQDIEVTDFEVVDSGPDRLYDDNCTRN